MGTIAENITEIRERIARAAERVGRRPDEVRLVAVSKTQPPERLREAVAAGVTDLGENYVQETEEKLRTLGPVDATVHLIGHLQKNKAGKAAVLFGMVQTVDTLELARALGRRAAGEGRTLDVLVEVNISGQETRFGVLPDAALDLAGEVAGVEGLRLRGLMGMAPFGGAGSGEAAVRNSFQSLKRLFDRLPAEHRHVLSMGMTGDFELAIAEGSTMVRVGTGIFGARAAKTGREQL